jgi:hypothetical protein
MVPARLGPLVVALCLVLAVAVWLIAGNVQVPVPVRYDYDEGVYVATADAVASGSQLYRDIFLGQPPAFVLMIRAMFGLWGTSLGVARNTVVVLSVVWLLAMLAILWARGSPWGGVVALCLVLGRATFLSAARTVEMEVPGEALACAAVALAAWGLRRPGTGWWAGAGILAALAAMTKLTAATVAIPLIGAVISADGPSSRWRWRMLAAGGLLALASLLPVVGTAGFVDQALSYHLALARTLDASAATHLVTIGRFLAEEWPLSLAALLGCWRAMAGGAAFERTLIAWLAADLVLLAALTPLWPHHLIILVSPMCLLAGVALPRQQRWGLSRAAVAIVIPALLAVCIMIYLGLAASALSSPVPSPQLAHVVRRIADAVPPGGTVLTDDPMVAFLARRQVADGLIDSSMTRIWAGHISEGRLVSALRARGTGAVVLWRGTFRTYFPGLRSAAAEVFPVAETFPGGRILLLKRHTATHSP